MQTNITYKIPKNNNFSNSKYYYLNHFFLLKNKIKYLDSINESN